MPLMIILASIAMYSDATAQGRVWSVYDHENVNAVPIREGVEQGATQNIEGFGVVLIERCLNRAQYQLSDLNVVSWRPSYWRFSVDYTAEEVVVHAYERTLHTTELAVVEGSGELGVTCTFNVAHQGVGFVFDSVQPFQQ